MLELKKRGRNSHRGKDKTLFSKHKRRLDDPEVQRVSCHHIVKGNRPWWFGEDDVERSICRKWLNSKVGRSLNQIFSDLNTLRKDRFVKKYDLKDIVLEYLRKNEKYWVDTSSGYNKHSDDRRKRLYLNKENVLCRSKPQLIEESVSESEERIRENKEQIWSKVKTISRDSHIICLGKLWVLGHNKPVEVWLRDKLDPKWKGFERAHVEGYGLSCLATERGVIPTGELKVSYTVYPWGTTSIEEDHKDFYFYIKGE